MTEVQVESGGCAVGLASRVRYMENLYRRPYGVRTEIRVEVCTEVCTESDAKGSEDVTNDNCREEDERQGSISKSINMLGTR